MPHYELQAAVDLWRKLRLGPTFFPVRRFGEASSYGKIFNTNGNKLMKVMAWSKNAEREMKIAKIAGNANIGPKVYNTRVWFPSSLSENALLSNLFPNRKYNKVAIITMDKVPRAKSLYNAINNGTITNFSKVENAIKRMHVAGIHHGNLHGGNILVYVTNSGNLKFIPINFGAAKYSKKITNTRSAARYATEVGGWRGLGKKVTHSGQTFFLRPGRNQPIRSNEAMLKHLRNYFNRVQEAKTKAAAAP